MSKRLLKVHPKDNVIVALSDLKGGEIIEFEKATYTILKDIPAKHKFAQEDFEAGDDIFMYGVLVGRAQQKIAKGEWITVFNVKHAANDFNLGERNLNWDKPNIEEFKESTF